MKKLLLRGVAVGVVALAAYLSLVVWRVYRQSTVDEAQPADVIVILGAAEYRGKPSPVLKARLDHGLELYRRNLAPYILTMGGAGGDPVFTEGEVGRDYLVRLGVPSERIVLEPEGESTAQSVAAGVEIMRRMRFASCIVVSDGYHIYRVKRMLEQRGVRAYGSPRPSSGRGGWRDGWLYVRQSIGYVLWQVGIAI